MTSVSPDTRDEPYLVVENLTVRFPTADGLVQAVSDLSYSVEKGKTLGIVGESGSGKSVSSMAVLGLHDAKRSRIEGSIRVGGTEVIGLSEDQMRRLRGNRVAMIFQDALAALNPVFKVGKQIAEAILVHQDLPDKEVKERVVELLEIVGIPNPRDRAENYPHEFSGGMRQRAMIAMSIANDPDLLIADEPTTALDVTIQAQVLDVLERIQDRTSSSIMLITHDLGVVAGVADRVLVMYAGRQVELGDVDQIFYEPRHPYTVGLLASLPRLDRRSDKTSRLHRIVGQPPSMIILPPGCAFHPRCPRGEVPGICDHERPELRAVGGDHLSACHFAEDLAVDQAVALEGPPPTPDTGA